MVKNSCTEIEHQTLNWWLNSRILDWTNHVCTVLHTKIAQTSSQLTHMRTTIFNNRSNCSNNSPELDRLSRYLRWTLGYIMSGWAYIHSYQVLLGPAHHARVDQYRPLDCYRRTPAASEGIRSIAFFTALHAMQMRSSDENSVRLSVRPSVCLSITRMHCDKTVERFFQIYILYERTAKKVQLTLIGSPPHAFQWA